MFAIGKMKHETTKNHNALFLLLMIYDTPYFRTTNIHCICSIFSMISDMVSGVWWCIEFNGNRHRQFIPANRKMPVMFVVKMPREQWDVMADCDFSIERNGNGILNWFWFEIEEIKQLLNWHMSIIRFQQIQHKIMFFFFLFLVSIR